MSEDPSRNALMAPPKPHKAARVMRGAAKAAAGSIPGAGAALSECIDLFVPNPEAKDRARWETEVTDEVNDLTGRVNDIDRHSTHGREVMIGGGAAIVAEFMVKCPPSAPMAQI